MDPLIQFSPALTNKRFLQKTAHSETMVSSVCSINKEVLCCQACKSKEEGPRAAAPTNAQVTSFVYDLTRRWGGSKAAVDSLYPSWRQQVSSLQSYLMYTPSSQQYKPSAYARIKKQGLMDILGTSKVQKLVLGAQTGVGSRHFRWSTWRKKNGSCDFVPPWSFI